MGNTTFGILLMLVSTALLNVGSVLQKKAVDGLPPLDGAPLFTSVRAVVTTPLWVLGWCATTVAVILNMVALGLADLSVIQPLNGFGLVVLALFSRFYLGERLDGGALGGIGLVMAGLVAVGLVLPESHAFSSPGELLGCFVRPAALAFLGAMLGTVAVSRVLARSSVRFAGVLFAFSAAVSSVLSFTLSKGLFGVLGMVGIGASVASWSSWLLLALILVFSGVALGLQTLSFQKGRAIVVTPVFGAFSVVLPLLAGRLVFAERLASVALVGPALIVAGVILLGMRETGAPRTAAA